MVFFPRPLYIITQSISRNATSHCSSSSCGVTPPPSVWSRTSSFHPHTKNRFRSLVIHIPTAGSWVFFSFLTSSLPSPFELLHPLQITQPRRCSSFPLVDPFQLASTSYPSSLYPLALTLFFSLPLLLLLPFLESVTSPSLADHAPLSPFLSLFVSFPLSFFA